MRKSTKQTIIVSIAILIVVSIVFLVVYNIQKIQIEKAYEVRLDAKESLLQSKKRIAYVPTKNIKPGVIVNKKNVQKIVYYSDSDQNQFFSESDLGKTALITLKKNQPILKSMITDHVVDSTVREQEFTEINLSANLQKDDLIDVRIVFPNGESYVVLSKKSIKQLSTENNGCYMNLDAEELDRIQGAFVDAYVNKATLYTVKYIQSSLQQASTVTYTPPVEIINLIKKDPDIVNKSSDYLSENARYSLESRLKVFRELLANRELEEKQQEQEILNLQNEDTEETINDDTETSISEETDSIEEESDSAEEEYVDEYTEDEEVEFID